MALSLVVHALCAGLLLVFAWIDIQVIWPILLALAVFGASRGFINPVQQSIVAEPRSGRRPRQRDSPSCRRSRATATVAGPLAGGLLYELSAGTAYGVTFVVAVLSIALVAMIPPTSQRIVARSAGWNELIAGFRYIWREKVVLGAISLDLFAVLLGGAVALMPVYARDILEVGPWGLGLLRAAPGIGGICIALYLAFYPLRDHAGLHPFRDGRDLRRFRPSPSASRPCSGSRSWR